MANAWQTRSRSLGADADSRRRLGLEHGGEHVGLVERAKDPLDVLGERRADVRIEMAARPPGDLARGRRRAALVVCDDGLLGNVHDPCGERQLVAAVTRGEALAVVALIDLVERRDRTVGQSEPGAERGANLAAAAGQLDAVSRDLGREAVDELPGARGPSPPTEARSLRGEHVRVGDVEHLELALKCDVVIEHLGEHRRVRGAPERTQERSEVRGGAVRGSQVEHVREPRRDGARAKPLLERDPGTQVRCQRQRPEQFDKPKQMLQAADANGLLTVRARRGAVGDHRPGVTGDIRVGAHKRRFERLIDSLQALAARVRAARALRPSR